MVSRAAGQVHWALPDPGVGHEQAGTGRGRRGTLKG